MGFIAKLEYATATNIGTRDTNQDRVLAKTGHIMTPDDPSDMPCGVFCVADGMGGLQEGELAASVTVDAIDTWWDTDFMGLNLKNAEVLDSFFNIFQEINDKIRSTVKNGSVLSGTTCSLLLIQGSQYYIAHTGDSRIYLAEQKLFVFPSTLNLLTEDHNWITDQMKKAKLSPSDIAKHPKRNMLTSCLGAFEKPRIFTHSGTIRKPCTFILCSDGLYKTVTNREIAAMARRYKDSKILADNYINRALKKNATDNISAVVIKVNRK